MLERNAHTKAWSVECLSEEQSRQTATFLQNDILRSVDFYFLQHATRNTRHQSYRSSLLQV